MAESDANAREAARASYARGCELGDASSCAWGASIVGDQGTVGTARLACPDPLIGRWIAAQRSPFAEIELRVRRHDVSGVLGGTIDKRVWSGGRGMRVPSHCGDYGPALGGPMVGRATYDLTGSAEGRRVVVARTETKRPEVECGLAPSLRVQEELTGDWIGANALKLREKGAESRGPLAFVRVACAAD